MNAIIDKEYCATFDDVEKCCGDIKEFLKINNLKSSSFKISLLAREALNNAVVHGSQITGCFKFSIEVKDDFIIFKVNDGGLGFIGTKDNIQLDEGTNIHGRGLPIMEKYAHEYNFNDKGNEVEIKLKIEG